MYCGQRPEHAGVSQRRDKQTVDVLVLCREHGPARVELAVRGVLAARSMGVLSGFSPGAPAPRCWRRG